MAYIISADEIKKTLPHYDPAHSEDVHPASAKLADAMYVEALKERPEKKVILMAGGTASGKSEYVAAYLETEDVIVFDGTLPTLQGATIKIKKAQKAGKKVEVHLVLPTYLTVAFIVFLNRERKLAEEHFFRTHAKSRKTVLEIAKTLPDIEIEIIESDVSFVNFFKRWGSMNFRRIKFDSKTQLIDFLRQNQYSETQIKETIHHDFPNSSQTLSQ